jgi:triacylglycerol lipase
MGLRHAVRGRVKAARRLLPGPVNSVVDFAGEVGATARCVIHYPLGVAETALTTGRPSGEAVHDTPVLLVHGYAHNQSGWWVMDRHLRQAGFTSVHRLNYLPMGSGVPQLAERLGARVDEIRSLTGADRVHVVAHSLGGILLRWYVQELGGDRTVGTAVTLGSPHEGTVAAWLWPERTARDLTPGSSVMVRLAAGARPSPDPHPCAGSPSTPTPTCSSAPPRPPNSGPPSWPPPTSACEATATCRCSSPPGWCGPSPPSWRRPKAWAPG